MTDPVRIDRYELKHELGRGGMATVYLAYDPRFKRDVAIKVLPRQFTHDPMFRARFVREAQTIAALEHPAIVPVYDFGEEDEQPYLVMRHMPGGSLADRIQKGALAPQAIISIMRRLGGALDEAHQHHVIHRDLKPGNILFDHLENAYLSDFGIVKLSEATSTFTGNAIIGTPAYMSPEQARGEANIDGRSDIYALGAILFEMLTGLQPYRADTPMGIIVKHLTEPVPHIFAVKRDVPPAYETLITQAMAKDRADRYASAGEMATAVQATLAATPPSSYVPPDREETYVLPPLPPTVPTPAATVPIPPKSPIPHPKPARRRWLGVVGLILLLALLGFGGYASGWFIAVAPPAPPSATSTQVATAVALVVDTETATGTAVSSPTPSATPPPSDAPTTAPNDTPTFTPTARPSATPRNTPTAIPSPTTTPTPLSESAPSPTPNSTPTSTASGATAAAPTPTKAAAAALPNRSLPIAFENFGCWSVGTQRNGTFCASAEQAQSGTAGKLEYQFLTEANDYVIFFTCFESYADCVGIPDDPAGLQVWVYGDGSGNFLNAWIIDSEDETWAVPLGTINFTGWQLLTGCIDAEQAWPGGHIAGPENDLIDYPIAFRALAFDDPSDGYIGEGAIYLDDLQGGDCA